ncbi:hypothetical protein IEO21_03989 [Rhodonia placenta]|uniref:Peptidase C14 caspase domain-containing protein n=1 Tax=Rhodonia placenta TaxID=104341 RepID=A0A8H7P4Z3_9APHY|nr:hypothetical protein IEO21_03989 [Postia placenta]
MPVPTRPPVRKALSIAVQYSSLKEYDLDLEGTHNDPRILADLLVDVYKYNREDITILIDDEDKKHSWPTRKNIENAMKSLLVGAQPGDHFVFHFSGHGALVPNFDGTEKSGYDEVIWPVDIEYKGDESSIDNYIKDDEIHDLLVEHVPVGAHFMMVFDCCHSGTMADLPNTSEDRPPTPSSATSTGSIPSAASVKNTSTEDGLQHKTTKEMFTPSAPLAQVPEANKPAVADVALAKALREQSFTVTQMLTDTYLASGHNPLETHHELLQAVTREIAKITAAINRHGKPADAPDFEAPRPEVRTFFS